MKAPECFDGTRPFKVRNFLQSFQLIFHNYPAFFSQARNKLLYATSFIIGRASRWIEPYFNNLTNQEPTYLLNSWSLSESQLFTFFGDPNEVRKFGAVFDYLIMKEVFDTPKGEDRIMGFDFPTHFNPSIDWRQVLRTFNSDPKDYYDSRKSFSNDVSCANSCEALGGDSRTP
ncbi:hypothetical protein O181_062296 [Austropuccinia psidii MF-1]|uniref:DUF4939 domain-containing protein n=1 Tax=Austropuccinia psidii MF-1 TaxID=1389203 RepID=A0A9Q3HYB1_9BASI|nr:hypothetical protein [Austropuccinia psidii MF-1]